MSKKSGVLHSQGPGDKRLMRVESRRESGRNVWSDRPSRTPGGHIDCRAQNWPFYATLMEKTERSTCMCWGPPACGGWMGPWHPSKQKYIEIGRRCRGVKRCENLSQYSCGTSGVTQELHRRTYSEAGCRARQDSGVNWKRRSG
jgi:hypothetical protein